MSPKLSSVVCWSFMAVVVVGLAIFVARDRLAMHQKVAELNSSASRLDDALAKARQQARQVIREKLRREEAQSAKDDAVTAVNGRKTAQERQNKVRRFFASRGFAASSSYLRAAAFPGEEPSEEDQEIIDLAGEAASEQDLETAADVLEAALAAQDPRARLAAVEMLSGLGEAGLVDISEFLRDPHPEVANLAADRWEVGIQELTDEKEQAALAKVGYLAMTDEDHLRSLGGTLMLVSDAKLVVDVLMEVMKEGASIQRQAARETYESVTGEKWTSEKAALAWLAENYEPPEPVEEEMSDSTESEETDSSDTTQTQEQENEPE